MLCCCLWLCVNVQFKFNSVIIIEILCSRTLSCDFTTLAKNNEWLELHCVAVQSHSVIWERHAHRKPILSAVYTLNTIKHSLWVSIWNSMMKLRVRCEANPPRWGMTASQQQFLEPWAPPQDREPITQIIHQTPADDRVNPSQNQHHTSTERRMVLRAVTPHSARASWVTSLW